jgi:hypothetical protein
VKRAKEVNRAIIKGITFQDYQKVVDENKDLFHKMYRIASKNHELFLYETKKKSLSLGCDKRKFDTTGDSLPYGHFSISNIIALYEN